MGLAPGALNTELIDEPLVNLSVDGRSAKGRWMSLSMLGDGKGKARIEGGVYENEYRRDGQGLEDLGSPLLPAVRGRLRDRLDQYRWRVTCRWFPFISPSTNPEFRFHSLPAPRRAAASRLRSWYSRSIVLNDEDAVRNLQHAYGYYVDRKMWDDVVDLFAEDSAVKLMGDDSSAVPWVCGRPWSEWAPLGSGMANSMTGPSSTLS